MGGGCLGGGRPRGAARRGTRPRLLWPCLTCCGCFAATHPTCTSSWPGRGMCSCQAVSKTNHFPPPPYPLPSGFCDDTNAGCYCPSNTTYGRIPAAVDAPLGEALALIVAAWMKGRHVRAALSQPCQPAACADHAVPCLHSTRACWGELPALVQMPRPCSKAAPCSTTARQAWHRSACHARQPAPACLFIAAQRRSTARRSVAGTAGTSLIRLSKRTGPPRHPAGGCAEQGSGKDPPADWVADRPSPCSPTSCPTAPRRSGAWSTLMSSTGLRAGAWPSGPRNAAHATWTVRASAHRPAPACLLARLRAHAVAERVAAAWRVLR